MHGMDPHDEIVYWRARAKEAERVLAAVQADANVALEQRREAEAECERMRPVYVAAHRWFGDHAGQPLAPPLGLVDKTLYDVIYACKNAALAELTRLTKELGGDDGEGES
jgi:hypothetical protein